MTRFSVGDNVIIRYGNQQGRKATIIHCQPVDAYKVKLEDGSVLFFSSKGLEKAPGLVIAFGLIDTPPSANGPPPPKPSPRTGPC